MRYTIDDVPRSSFRLPFGLGIGEPLRADSYNSENIVVGRTGARSEVDGVFLGKLAEFEQMRRNVWLDCTGAHAVYVVGKRRSGKSYTLGALCEGLVASNWLRLGEPNQAVLLIDTLNIYGTLHVPTGDNAEARDWCLPNTLAPVKYFVPAGTPSITGSVTERLTLDPSWLTLEDWCSLFEVDPFADPLGHLLSVVVGQAQRDWNQPPGSAPASSGIGAMLAAIGNHPDAHAFEESTRDALRRRLLAVERLNFFAHPSAPIDAMLVGGQLTVCQLRDLDLRIRSLLVAVVIRELTRARSRADAAERIAHASRQTAAENVRVEQEDTRPQLPRCWIAIDEAHNYLPAAENVPSRPVLRRLITEGRNIGLSIVVATQQPSGLDASIQRNADTLLIHSMSMKDDIVAAENMVNTRLPESASLGGGKKATGRIFEKIVRALPQGYCLVSTDTASRVFGLKVRPRLSLHGGETY